MRGTAVRLSARATERSGSRSGRSQSDRRARRCALAASTDLPIALGEHIYNPEPMAQFIRRQALHFVQPDVTRIGGVGGVSGAVSRSAESRSA